MSEITGIKFRPVMGPEEIIKNTVLSNGYMYVATDSGNMYLDVNNHRISIGGAGGSGGGSSSFVWANGNDDTITKATDDLSDGDTTYYLNCSIIEDGILPKVDNLILNSDGRFFRVREIDPIAGIITADLIAVSGSGGGGGGGSVVDLRLTWDNIDSLGTTYIYKQSTEIKFYPESDADDSCSILVEVKNAAGDEVATRQGKVRNNTAFVFDTAILPVGLNFTMYVTIKSDSSQYNAGRGLKKSFPIKIVDMHLEKQQGSDYSPLQNSETQISYIPYFGSLNVTLHTSVDGEEYENSSRLIPANSGSLQSVTVPKQLQGTHTVELWLTTLLNDVEYESDKIAFDIPWYDNDDDNPLLWVGDVEPVVVQYEQALIHYMVYSGYNEKNGLKTEVRFYKDGVQVDTAEVQYSSTEWLTWDVTTLYDVGENNFSISCGSANKEVSFSITTEGARDLSLVRPSALALNFNSMGRSNTQIKSDRQVWKSETSENIQADLINFNWSNNGWFDDNNGLGSYLSVANGASVRIPYENISMNTGTAQYTFEIRFRIRNAHKYATLVTEIPLFKYWVTGIKDSEGNITGTVNTKGEEKTEEWLTNHYSEEDNGDGTWTIHNAIKLDEDGNPEMEESNTTEKRVETENNVAFKYLNSNNEGFCIGTQEAYFNAAGKVVNVRYKEGEIINISFVVDKLTTTLYIYLNGILSGATSLSTVGTIDMNNTAFLISSEYCDFDLYKFRMYSGNPALTMPEIIHNYLADIKDINLYDENDLADVNDATKLSYDKLVAYNEEHPENLTMPYAVFDMSDNTEDYELPHFKGGNKNIAVEFTNPSGDKMLDDGNLTPYQYYSRCPSYKSYNTDINVQGTSSQKYPRRNFKLKFKNSNPDKGGYWVYTHGPLTDKPVYDTYYFSASTGEYLPDITDDTYNSSTMKKLAKNFHMDNEFLGTNKFTWKIDYMESSGSYNTGFANLMGSGIYDKHPLDDIGYNASAKNYRTSVYGFPLLVFHKTPDGKYTYIGRYNMNLDKSSNEYYGFEEKYVQPYMDGTSTVKDISECWELRDNQGTWCSFRYPTAAARRQGFMTPTADSTTGMEKIEVAQHFESRYHIEADAIETSRKYSAIDEDGKDWSSTIGGNTNNAMCAYLNAKLSNIKVLFDWLDATDTKSATNRLFSELRVDSDYPYYYNKLQSDTITYEVNARSDDSTVTYETRTEGGIEKIYGTFTCDTIEYRRQKFRAEFEKHLDKHYCLIYFIMTELLLCYDSRGKNMMIASFGPHEVGGDFIWYPIFYDIDTQLGLNNVGAWLWDYDTDSSENKIFSTGESVLWVNFYDMFKSDIIATYKALRQTKVTYETIEGSYNCNPNVYKQSTAMKGKRPILAIGLDEYYKYVLPVTLRWKAQDGSYITANYLYACQGDRILSRELLINNRILYMDSKWHAGNFVVEKSMTNVTFRVSGNDPINTSDKYLENSVLGTGQQYGQYPVPYYDANPNYIITPYLNFYLTWFTDENVFANAIPFNASDPTMKDGQEVPAGEDIITSFRSGTVDEQLNYFPGADYISSFGDLSIKYLTQVNLPQGAKLLDISIGSDAPNYYNNKQLGDFDLGTGIDSNEKSLLEKINLTNFASLSDIIDARNPKKLKEFRALGTSIPYVLFADGAPLDTVHLPSSITRVKFNSNRNLTRILTSPPQVAYLDNGTLTYYNHSNYEGLYIQGATDFAGSVGAGSNISEIEFEDDAMNYDSYILLNNVVKAKTNTGSRLKIRMIDVNWTPFTLIEYGEAYNSNLTYKILNDHSSYDDYTYTTLLDWRQNTLNQRIYSYNSEANQSAIQDLSMLDTFILDYEDAVRNRTINQFTNNNESMSSQATVPTLTGNLYVSNTQASAIDEVELTNTYGVNWPNLKITAAYVDKAYVTKYVVVDPMNNQEVQNDIRYGATQTILLPNKVAPTRQHYDFQGFGPSVDSDRIYVQYNDGTYSLTEEGAATLINSETKAITLYAIFTRHNYTLSYRYTDGTLIQDVLAPYQSGLIYPTVVPHMDESQLSLERKYALLGYSTSADATKAQDFSRLSVNKNMTLYAIFEEASVYSNPIDLKYINKTRRALYDRNDVEISGWEIGLKPQYAYTGKITLPSWIADEDNGNQMLPVISIAQGSTSLDESPNGFCSDGGIDWNTNTSPSSITHIFFDTLTGVPSLLFIGQYAFYNCKYLTYFDFPSTLRDISVLAFRDCTRLSVSSIDVFNLDGGVFAQCPLAETFIISPALQRISGGATFQATTIKHLTIGSSSEPSRLVSCANGTFTASPLIDITLYTDNPSYYSAEQTPGLYNIVNPSIVEV